MPVGHVGPHHLEPLREEQRTEAPPLTAISVAESDQSVSSENGALVGAL